MTPLLIFTAACEFGSDGDKKADKVDKVDNKGGESAPTSIAPPPSSVAPGSSADTRVPTSAGPVAGKALTSAQLKAALVTQNELGTGWTVTPGDGAAYGSSPMKAVEVACQPLLDVMTGAGPKAAANAGETLATAADKGTTTRLDLVRYDGDAFAKTLDAAVLIASKHDCLEVVATNVKGERTAYRFDVGDHQPQFGDGALWLDVMWGDEKTMADPDAPTMTSRLQFVRVGSVLVRFDSRPENTSFGAEYIPDAQVKTQADKVAAALKR
ncbi:hypothetical protein [Streptodolium elevatio]